jgi:hypothetical protein
LAHGRAWGEAGLCRLFLTSLRAYCWYRPKYQGASLALPFLTSQPYYSVWRAPFFAMANFWPIQGSRSGRESQYNQKSATAQALYHFFIISAKNLFT